MQIHRPSIPKTQTSTVAPAFYRLLDVVRICALSRSTIYRLPSRVGRAPWRRTASTITLAVM